MTNRWMMWCRAVSAGCGLMVAATAWGDEAPTADAPVAQVVEAETSLLDAAVMPPSPGELPANPISYQTAYETPPPPVPMVTPAPPPAPAAPKKPAAPPAFPGPKTLPPTGPYKALYFLNDFSYKKDPKHEHVFGEELKDMQYNLFEECLTISTGGEIRHRYMNEDNRLRPGGPVHADNQLWRWRHYIDAKYGDFRVYFEGINADSFGNDAPDQAIDVNRWDIQNLFVDVNLLEDEYGKHTVRYGRQELLFGRQRLVSPLDWANTRRNFQGGRYMWKGKDFTLDGFLVHPVNSATGFNAVALNDNKFDEPNYDVWFGGTYFSYTGYKNTVIDAYWLLLDTRVQDPARPDGERHLLGSRWSHLVPVTDCCGNELRVWDFDTEGGFQFGEDNGEYVTAGFYSAIAGHTWKQPSWTPRLSGLFYYGSGDR
ncbi:MAG TPA: alginate export family protein, partial [Planctomycetaceae bacterium]|nr:alginate export family protein [Planctomycetaceae bacterium]